MMIVQAVCRGVRLAGEVCTWLTFLPVWSPTAVSSLVSWVYVISQRCTTTGPTEPVKKLHVHPVLMRLRREWGPAWQDPLGVAGGIALEIKNSQGETSDVQSKRLNTGAVFSVSHIAALSCHYGFYSQ